MPKTQTATPTFESVWAALMENREQLKETDRIVKENAKQIGRINNRFGEVVEYMVAPNLRKKFRELGLNFPKANPNSDLADYDLVCNRAFR